MNNFAYNTETLYQATNQGLDILQKYVSIPAECENGKKPFFFRKEKTASAYLKKSKKGDHYVIVDFGDKNYTPIDVVMEKLGMTFGEALKHLYCEFHLAGASASAYFLPQKEYKTLQKEDTTDLKWFNVEYLEDLPNLDLVGKHITHEVCQNYNFKQIKSYEFIFISSETKQKSYCKISATDSYPIFGYENGEFVKLYCPNAIDKKYKHSFIGKKPQTFVYGLDNLLTKVTEIRQAEAKEKYPNPDLLNYKEDKIFIATGGSDGMNLAALGYNVIWFNSEAEQVTPALYKQLQENFKQIYNLPDIDKSGIKYAYEVAEKFWAIKTIWLPKDKMGKGKDFRDWLKIYNNEDIKNIRFHFNNLVNSALQCKFFYKNNNDRYQITSTYLHYFLKIKGFGIYYIERQYNDKNTEQQYIYIRIENNVVKQYFPEQIRKFVELYLIEKGQPIAVIDLIKNTEQFSDKRLNSIDRIEIETKNHDHTFQRFYFENNFIEITADAINFKPYKELNSQVWDYNIKNKKILQTSKNFEIYEDETLKVKRPRILQNNNMFMNYLINGSRTFWKEDLQIPYEDNPKEKEKYFKENHFTLNGANLTIDQQLIQEQHFMNKCYAIGYLLHREKIDSLAKMVYIMEDLTKTDEDASNGGTGKSLMIKGIEKLLFNNFHIDGKNKNITNNNFLFDGFDKEKQLIHVEDINQYLGIEFFYNIITSKINVNPKHGKPYTVEFEDASKIVCTSNFGISKMDQSTARRLLFVSFSDYYHLKINNENYLEDRQVSDDFGVNLFSHQWDTNQWNYFFNFLFECLQMYLQNVHNIFEAPKNNIYKTNSQALMGNSFMEWADGYFFDDFIDEESPAPEVVKGNLNTYINKKEMFKNYTDSAGKFPKTAQNFKTSLKEYCKTKEWEFNPKEEKGYNEKTKSYKRRNGDKGVEEFFYIKTKPVNEIEIDVNPLDF